MNKIIHYCWFGKNEKSDLINKCIDSWKKYCPDYQIKEWNEDNFDTHCCLYVEQAYETKKWAFVSDYCRFHVLNQYGGIYLDTDVELIRNLDDLPDTFVGFENQSAVASGLIRGANQGDKICRLMLDSYHNDVFLKSDGRLNLVTVCERETKLLQEFGLILDGKQQFVAGTTIYPAEYFCPLNSSNNKLTITDNTYSIHHYGASWYGDKESYMKRLRFKISKVVPMSIASRLAFVISIVKYEGIKGLLKNIKDRF